MRSATVAGALKGPMDERNGTDIFGLIRRLKATRGLTAAAMVVERLWPLLLPFILVVGVFLTVSWFGLFRQVPEWARITALGIFGLGLLASLYPLRFYRQPRAEEIDARIEATNRLLHAPVRTQSDRLSGADDPFAMALWREHQKRMAERLAGLSSGAPRTGVPDRDPLALRAVVALLLVVAFGFSLSPYGGQVFDAFRPVPGAEPVPPRIDAWVTPPAYTGKPPVFLTARAQAPLAETTTTSGEGAGQPVAPHIVPEGSELVLRVTGGSGSERLEFADQAGNLVEIAPQGAAAEDGAQPTAETLPANPQTGARQFVSKLATDGSVTLRRGETVLSSWSFAVTQDNPPAIRFTEDPKRSGNGSLDLAYAVEDDYGVTGAKAEIALADEPAEDARPLYDAPEMPLALPRRGGEQARKTARDLSEHPWAGADADIALVATDGAGQEARSEIKPMVLPERTWTNPLAKALIEQRRMIALNANAKPDVLDLIDAITLRPEDTIPDSSNYLGLMSARSRLDLAETDDQLREVVDYFWEIALSIEDGQLSSAERRLRQAQEALKQALENNASDEEIEERMAELRQAMQEFLREFAERAQQNPEMAQQMPQEGQELSQSDLEKMMDQIEELAKSGQKDQAQELLSQLEQMMQNLQAGRQQQQQQGQQGEQSEMRQQMDKLGEIMRRQQEMMNETFRLDQMQRSQQGEQGEQGQQGQEGQGQQDQQGQQGQSGQGQPGGQGQGGQGNQPMSPQEFAEALRQLQEGQGQLQQELDALTKGLEGMGMQPGEGFGDAGEAMGRAEGALGESQGERAVGEQGQALEALRRGAQDMMQQMQQAQQGEEGGSENGGRQQSSERDPLGRPRATTGPDLGNSVEVPDEIDAQRARRILEAIRERLGNALSPELERSYLERLLELQ